MANIIRRFVIPAVLVTCAGALHAQDYGDAPASYGLAEAGSSLNERLGTAWTTDGTNPVTPAWSGDTSDDGVSTIPTWTPGVATNSVSIYVDTDNYTEYLTMWVDLNDDGDFLDTGERIDHPSFPTSTIGTYTFNNIALPSQAYSLNGTNKIAVRFMLKFNSAIIGPTDVMTYGEVEDYLFDVVPINGVFINTNTSLPVAAEGSSYNPVDITAFNGPTPYTWVNVSGAAALPAGMNLVQIGDDFRLSGTPAAGAGGQNYNFTVEVTDANTDTDQKVFSIFVTGPPAQLPFIDDFSTDTGWTLGSGAVTWVRAPAAANSNGEPTTDQSPSTDNYILSENLGLNYPANMTSTVWAESPVLDCSTISNVELKFWRWLGVETSSFDQAYVEVSPDNGQNWSIVWQNAGTITESSWTQQAIDISTEAGNQAAVKVRFGIGTTDGSVQYHGWSIDDFEVRELPSTTKLIITDFDVVTPYTVGSQNDPKVYTGTQATFEVTVDNTTANDITVNSFSVLVTDFTSGGTENVGTWMLASSIPFVVSANTTGQILTGTFDCTSVPSAGSGAALRATAMMQGAEAVTTKPVETEFIRPLYVDQGPPPTPPAMEVYETSFQGAPVTSGLAAAGTNRDYGSQDIDAGTTGFRNIVIINTTGSQIDVGTPVLVGVDAAHFRLDTAQWTSSSMTLGTSGAASQIFFSVRFDPHAIGQLDAQVEFTHTALNPTTNPFIVPVTGTGTGNPPELQVHEIDFLGPKIANGQAAAGTNRDFGSVPAGGFSQFRNVVLWNRFVTDTTINPLPTISGPDAADFTIDTSSMNNPHVILGSTAFVETTFFSVAFWPQAGSSVGTKTATVSFGHNASNPAANPFTFEVTGEVIPTGPSIDVYELNSVGSGSFNIPNGAAAIQGRDFGTQLTSAGATAYLDVRIYNPGSSNLTLGTPVLTGADAGEFVLDVAGFPPSLTPGTFTTFGIAFDPNTAGQKLASVSFTHNATAVTATPYIFDVTGLGRLDAPEVEVREGSLTGAVVAYGQSALGTNLDFGGQDINAGASAAVTIYIINTGTQDLNLGAPVFFGGNSTEFSLTATGFPAVVTPGNDVSFDVVFDPTTFGNKSTQLRFTHDDPGPINPFSFEVAGFGDAPTIEVRETSITGPIIAHADPATGARDFGGVQLAAMPSAPLTVTIINGGNAPLTLNTPTITGANSGSFTLNVAGITSPLPAGQNTSFTVTFNAAQVGLKEATVNIGNDAGVNNPFSFDIAGLAQDPAGVKIDSNAGLPDAQIGSNYKPVQLVASGGTGPYTWGLRPGNQLPVGLGISTAGEITGQPTGTAGNYQFEIRVADANGGTSDLVFSMAVQPAPGTGFGKSSGKASGGGGCVSTPGGQGLWLMLAVAALVGVVAIRRSTRRA